MVFAVLCAAFYSPAAFARQRHNPLTDSLLRKAFRQGKEATADIKDYRASLYVRCRMNVKKQNALIRLVPSMFRFQKGMSHYIAETNNELHYTAPNIYDRKINEITGTFPHLKSQPDIFTDYFYVNLYSTTLLQDRLLSPLAPENASYYRYQLDDYASLNDSVYKILFRPKSHNTQLVRGEMTVGKHSGVLRSITMEGSYELLHFSLYIRMGREGIRAFLPERYNATLEFRFCGNRIGGSYLAVLSYDSIQTGYLREKPRLEKRLDLTQSYRLSSDNSRFFRTARQFSPYRKSPLEAVDSMIYIQAKQFNDSADLAAVSLAMKPPKRRLQWGKIGEMMLSSHRFNMSKSAYMRVSPILNPVLLSYNTSYGYSYRADFPFSYQMKKGRSLWFAPRIGYNFSQSQFYWQVGLRWNYLPKRLGYIDFKMGNGERIYNSSVLDKLKSMSTHNAQIDFSKLNLEYFNDLTWDFSHRIELFNGLRVDVGLSYHRRTPFEKSDIGYEFDSPFGQAAIKTIYVSLAPRIHIAFTPGQYYYIQNWNKVNVRSKFPTFSVDWEKGLKGMFGSSLNYERIEFELFHKVRVKSLRSFTYRAGYGQFLKQTDIFFVDYRNLTRYSLPYGWEDEIGGLFQLLDRHWYNSSTYYIRGNLIYESPMMMLTRVSGLTRFIQQERLYFNILQMKQLRPYWEIGYGFGTHVFDFGFFVNNINGKFNTLGCKFTFELFNK